MDRSEKRRSRSEDPRRDDSPGEFNRRMPYSAVLEALANDQPVAPRLEAEPLPQPLGARKPDLEAAVGRPLDPIEVARRAPLHGLRVLSLVAAEAQIVNRVPTAADHGLVLAADGGRLVVVVRVVGADPGRLVGRAPEDGEGRVAVSRKVSSATRGRRERSRNPSAQSKGSHGDTSRGITRPGPSRDRQKSDPARPSRVRSLEPASTRPPSR